MLLETLDVRKNDVLIYSQNKFDFDNNFKIIFKREKIKRPKKISYFEVCEFVKDTTPKNLIVYRLLTNVQGLDAFSTKYGYFIKIDHKMELVYFDPIFALKDLKHLKFNLEPEEFRFKIQQLGLTTLSHNENEAVYAEVYNFDLRAEEAKTQNDKIFADAIFIFDDNFYEEEFDKNKIVIPGPKDEKVLNLKTVIEPDEKSNTNISKVNLTPNSQTSSLREQKVNILKQALGISKINSDNLEQHKKTKTAIDGNDKLNDKSEIDDEIPSENVFNLFKTASKFDYLANRKDESYILRIDNE